jgi:hypothetical protein
VSPLLIQGLGLPSICKSQRSPHRPYVWF